MLSSNTCSDYCKDLVFLFTQQILMSVIKILYTGSTAAVKL